MQWNRPEAPADLPPEASVEPLPGEPVEPAQAAPAAEGEWHRQDPRMLLVHPVKLVGSLVPLLLVLLFTQRGEGGFQLFSGVAAAVIAVIFTLVQYLTLRYRVGPDTVQVRQGWLVKNTTTARIERVRTVDVEGSPLMRVLGLRTIKIGTGVDDTQVELEGVRTADAHALRESLLRRSRQARSERHVDAPRIGADAGARPAGEDPGLAGVPASDDLTGAEADERPETTLVRWDTAWLRFAPLGASGLLVAGAVLGFGGQFFDDIANSSFGRSVGGRVLDVLHDLGLWAFIGLALVLAALLALLTSFLAYVLGWWNLHVTRSGHGTLHVSRGLTTTRSATMEERKVRGVLLTEPWQQRWQKGASVAAIVTGAEEGTVDVLPTVPRDTARSVAVDVLASGEDRPVLPGLWTMPLRSHGPKALRRMTMAALIGLFWVGLVPAAAAFWGLRWLEVDDLWGLQGPWAWSWVFGWTAFMAVVHLAPVWPAWRSLGHAVTDHHLVVREGAILRRHLALEVDGILSWTMRQSFFQRRLDLCTLEATVAGGNESYQVPNVPVPDAVALMRAASPELLAPFSRAA